MRSLQLFITVVLMSILGIVYGHGSKIGLNFQDMSPSQTIQLSTESGLNGTVWMGDGHGWVVATDPDLYDITLTGKSDYWLEHVESAYPGVDGSIGYAKYTVDVGSYRIIVDFLDSDYLDPAENVYNQVNMLLRWDSGCSCFEVEHINHTWHEVSAN